MSVLLDALNNCLIYVYKGCAVNYAWEWHSLVYEYSITTAVSKAVMLGYFKSRRKCTGSNVKD